MKTINVVAAVIRDDDNRIFSTQRGYGDWRGWWEFPGGKIERDERPEEALVREIREELDTEVDVEGLLCRVEYDYPDFHLSMMVFNCSVVSGDLRLLEHEAARWLKPDELRSVKWLPADEQIITLLEK